MKYLGSYNLYIGLLFIGLYINKIKYIKRTMNTNLKKLGIMQRYSSSIIKN